MQKHSQRQPVSQDYQFLDKLGEGSFGYIWKVRHIKTGQIFACKLVKNSMKKERQLLQREIKILHLLKGRKGFTQMVAYGSDAQNTYFVMHLLGENLDQVRVRIGAFKLATFLSLGMQMVTLIRDLHSLGVLHRDIKPENFVVFQDKLHLIDFGLSKIYVENGRHILYKENKGMIGTARYASINALKGNEQSRRDDLESIGYLLLYMYNGSLPWMNITTEDRHLKYHRILKMKEALKLDQLFGVPEQLTAYFNYVKSLEFESTPDYEYLLDLFRYENFLDSPRLGIHHNLKMNIKSTLIKVQTISSPKCNTCRPSPARPRGNNSSRRLTLEDLSSEGADIMQELRFAEHIKIRNFDIGIKQPPTKVINEWSTHRDSECIMDEFEEGRNLNFSVPKTLLIKQ